MRAKTVFFTIVVVCAAIIVGCDKRTAADGTAGRTSSKQRLSIVTAVEDRAIDYVTKNSTGVLMKTIGGPALEIGKGMTLDADGSSVIAGYTSSAGAGGADAYLVKVDPEGNVVWAMAYGGTGEDAFYSVSGTKDGGYIAAGKFTHAEAKNRDLYVVKTDRTGQLIWETILGGEKEDEANFVIPAHHSGYIIAGLTMSKGEVNGDAWLIKLSENGAVEWEKTYGTAATDYANAVTKTADGGYAFTGIGGDKLDIMTFKTNGTGDAVWEKYMGTPNYDMGNWIVEVGDGLLFASGVTQEKPNTKLDAVVINYSAEGDIIWYWGIRAPDFSSASCIEPLPAGGFITCGTTIEGPLSGGGDIYIMELTHRGQKKTSRTIGGTDIEYGNRIIPRKDGKYVFTGYIGYRAESKAGNFDIIWGTL